MNWDQIKLKISNKTKLNWLRKKKKKLFNK